MNMAEYGVSDIIKIVLSFGCTCSRHNNITILSANLLDVFSSSLIPLNVSLQQHMLGL